MNWEQFLHDYQIPYVTRGPNTKKGEVSVKCPWCGEEDPSEHLGINLTEERWGCHRNSGHRGKRPHKLIQGLLGCSFGQAKLILAQYGVADPDSFDDISAPKPKEANEGTPLSAFDDFTPLRGKNGASRFLGYLKDRGFNSPAEFAYTYSLHYTTTGRWKDRVIIPIYVDGKLIAWTARAIAKTINAPRYLSSSQKIKTTVFNEDTVLVGGEMLLVGEGPFDALKLDYYGMHLGAVGTCIFGTSVTIDQLCILKEASKLYKQTVLLLDTDAIEATFMISEWLPEAIIGALPSGLKDPGDMTKNQVHELIKNYR